MFSLCHPWFTTTNFSYTFPILETSATASCGSTGIISRVISATQKSCILAASCGPPHPMKLQIWVWLTKARDERCQPNGYARFIKYWPNIDCQTNTEKWTIRGCLLSEWRNSYLTGIKKPDQSFPRNVSKHRFANVRWLQKRKSYVPNGDVP